MSDEPRKLIERFCRSGDQGAFNTFYRRQADRLWRYLRFRGCPEEAAYDLVAESFTRFVKSVCADPRAPVGFLYRIAMNLHVDFMRRAAASPVDVDSARIEDAPDPSGEAADERAYLRQLVGRLEADEQNLLLMRYWIGLTHREIAENLGMPEGTVRRRCAALLSRLREAWRAGQDG